ncbi:Bug family tripartite tricarboxylate transporter substrate binding protein [Fodinicurvata sediminis]|uniref:Bug family tripartite tricarboxylate transporter substrate binding protein n=1 Tax=Fodinicurvata sediminis TaxID=1121832 RepID=UPI0003B383FF|nr:tripartite tricarboxylate transporter substrate binding protein [Fodinicurvata sediminis]
MKHGSYMAALAALALTGSLAVTAANAESFPSKSVELVIPFAQGGGTDQVGRIFAEYAERHLGGDIFVSNRTGGSGAVGFSHGANAEADGHVITMVVTTLAAAPHTIDGYPVSYKDFEPVCLLSAPPAVLAVHPESGIDSLTALVEKAKAEPGELTFGTAGPGSNTHLTGAAFATQADIDISFVPHKGSGPALTAAYGKHIDVAIADKAEVTPWHNDNRLEVLTVFTDDPKAGIDGVPLATDEGYSVDIGSFRGIGAPKGTSPEAMEVLIDACRSTAEDPDFIAHMERTGTEPYVLFGEEFGSWLQNKHEAFGEAAKAADM